MNIKEAKELFKKHHTEEADYMRGDSPQLKREAGCVWYGFKSALKVTGQLKE